MADNQFLQKIGLLNIKSADRAVALLWYHTVQGNDSGLTCTFICKSLEDNDFGKQNPTRLARAFSKDKRVVLGSGKNFKISIKAMPNLTNEYASLLEIMPAKPSDSVVEQNLFKNCRGYTKKVIHQLNASYDHGLYDCCAVMCRRLLETLIIESYQEKKLADEIKDSSGYYFMFSGLLNHIENNKQIHLGRNSLRALKDFKILGDLSAHNICFNARKPDIDKIQNGLRIVCEELLYLANQAP